MPDETPQDATEEFERRLLAALDDVKAPTGKGLVEGQILAGLTGQDQALTIALRRPHDWPEPVVQRIENQVRSAVAHDLPEIGELKVEWRSAAPPQQGGGAPGPGVKPGLPQVRHVVAVGSGKGGVGKSTVAVSLAYALKRRGHKVGVMDADVYGPSVPHMLGLHHVEPKKEDGKHLAPEIDGIQVMSMGFLVPPEQAVVWRGPMLHKSIQMFLHGVAWRALDYLIVDLPPGTGDVVLSLSQELPLAGGVVVCTPQDVALLDARKAVNMFATVKIPCLGVVENMSYFVCDQCEARHEIFGHGGAERFAGELGVPFLGRLPINLAIREHGDQGRVRDNFAGPVADDLLSIADNLVASVRDNAPAAAPEIEVLG